MKYSLIDRILDYQEGKGIRAAKSLSLAEEYLADHFPGFPVLPGVLMIEAMTQTAAWYLRLSQGMRHPVVTLKQASHVRFGHFVIPGDVLVMELSLTKEDRELGEASFRGKGRIHSLATSADAAAAAPVACQARLTVASATVSEVGPEIPPGSARLTEDRIREELERELASLRRDLVAQPGAGGEGG